MCVYIYIYIYICMSACDATYFRCSCFRFQSLDFGGNNNFELVVQTYKNHLLV